MCRICRCNDKLLCGRLSSAAALLGLNVWLTMTEWINVWLKWFLFHLEQRSYPHVTLTRHFILKTRNSTGFETVKNRFELFLPAFQLSVIVSKESTVDVAHWSDERFASFFVMRYIFYFPGQHNKKLHYWDFARYCSNWIVANHSYKWLNWAWRTKVRKRFNITIASKTILSKPGLVITRSFQNWLIDIWK